MGHRWCLEFFVGQGTQSLKGGYTPTRVIEGTTCQGWLAGSLWNESGLIYSTAPHVKTDSHSGQSWPPRRLLSSQTQARATQPLLQLSFHAGGQFHSL